jgi:uncharacterized protein YuzE
VTLTIGNLVFDHVVYDADSDVLYLSIGEPRAAVDTEETSQGHAIRYDADGEIIGITIVNAKWLIERDGQIELPLRLDAEDLAPALSG